MDVLNITDNEDGSANVELEVTREELTFLLEIGFNKILKEGVENSKNVSNWERTKSSE